MFFASNYHRQDRYPATCGCTNQALTTPGSLAPQNLAAGPEQNPLCRIVDIGREGEGRFLFLEQAAR